MSYPVDFDPVQPDAAIAWLRARAPMTRAEWDALTREAREKAFMVSGVAQLDVVEHAWRAVDAAIASGTTLDEFKKAIGASLKAAWAGTVDNPPWRLETIFRTNAQLAYSRGRFDQMTDPVVLEDHPYWLFDAVLDGRQTKICGACDGKVLRADDPWWASHVPPLHFNCRSAITTLSAEQAQDMGITPHAPKVDAAAGFGHAPTPLNEWQPDPADYPEQLWLAHRAKMEAGGPPASHPAPPSGGSDNGGGPPKKPPPWKQKPPPWKSAGSVGTGTLDETARKFPRDERPIVELLVAEGNNVVSRSDKAKIVGPGRNHDAFVNGEPVEFKTPIRSSIATVGELILSAVRKGVQAPNVIVDVRGLALRQIDAEAIIKYARPKLRGRLDHVRIVGDTFDRTYSELDP